MVNQFGIDYKNLKFLIGSIVIFVVFGVLLFPSAGRDDVHITYWAAYTLSQYGEILNYNLDRVEQSSSILHVFLLAIAHELTGIRLPTLGGLMSVMFGVLTIFVCWMLLEVNSLKSRALFVVASCPPLVYWSFGSLETSIAAFIITALALIAALKMNSVMKITLFFILVCSYSLVRPEGVFVMGAFLFGLVLFDKDRKVYFCVVLLLLAFAAAVFALRSAYFSDYFPQPVSAKLGSATSIRGGREYLLSQIAQYPFLVLLYMAFVVGFFKQMRLDSWGFKFSADTLLLGSVLSFVLFSGGDWMEGARFLVPVLPLLVVFMFKLDLAFFKNSKIILGAILINGILALSFSLSYSTSFHIHQYLKVDDGVRERYSFFEYMNAVHFRDIEFLEKILPYVEENVSVENPTLLSQQAGFVMFHLAQRYAGEFRFVDLVSLSTRDVSACAEKEKLKRRRSGVHMTYKKYFELSELKCDLPMPDWVFDLDDSYWSKSKLLGSAGYYPVAEVSGHYNLGRSVFDHKISKNQFLMVREN